jgi:2-polyprenyl-3-methyl-5-hydroxy-6-metoxy-1,4-benzoquinol methylase
MGALAARFFTHLQAASFYDQLLRDALSLLPDSHGRTLLDIGCGPGALTRLAAARGYHATGIDNDEAMIAQAKRNARREKSKATFAISSLYELPSRMPPADVVVAASLLAVLPDPSTALDALWSCVAASGTLLIVEPSQHMTPANARRLIAERGLRRRDNLLTLWAHARHGSTIDPRIFDALPQTTRRHDRPMLGGLVLATLIEKAGPT